MDAGGAGCGADINLTAVYGAPPASVLDQPAAFAFPGPNTQHVMYRGTNSHIFEVIVR